MKFLADQNRRRLTGALLALLLLIASGPGCASLINVGIAASDDRAPAPYGGTILDGAIILAGPEERGGDGFFIIPTGGPFFVLALIDLPLSFAMDTALLPIALVWMFFDYQGDPYENLQKPPEEMQNDATEPPEFEKPEKRSDGKPVRKVPLPESRRKTPE